MGKHAYRGDRGRHPGGSEGSTGKRLSMEQWLERYPPPEGTMRDTDPTGNDAQKSGYTRKRLLELEPQAVLDLHGFTSDQAVDGINRFIDESFKNGLIKVLIVHGKGNHSPDGGILARVTAECVSAHPLAGENALSKGRDGGSGARWVILRQRSR